MEFRVILGAIQYGDNSQSFLKPT